MCDNRVVTLDHQSVLGTKRIKAHHFSCVKGFKFYGDSTCHLFFADMKDHEHLGFLWAKTVKNWGCTGSNAYRCGAGN